MFKKSYTFDDITLVPSYSNSESRLDADTTTWITNKTKIKIPYVNSPMDRVIGPALAEKLLEWGTIPIFDRSSTLEHYENIFNKWGQKVFVSTGVNDLDFTKKVIDLGFDKLLLDTANGWTKRMLDFIQEVKKFSPDVQIMGGNICTSQGYMDLVNAGVNSVRAGIGGGCFTESTRVLKADGTYENINKLKIGEYVLNAAGNPVKIKRVINNGFKKVAKVKFSTWYDPTFVTLDHLYYMGDCSHLSDGTVKSSGIARTLNKTKKCHGGSPGSHNDWVPIGTAIKNPKKYFSLTPSVLNLDLPQSFVIDLEYYSNRIRVDGCKCQSTGSKNGIVEFNKHLYSTYELGYIFGTFLGDGCSHFSINKNSNCESAVVNWYFGVDEEKIAEKLKDCLEKVLGQPNVRVFSSNERNTINVTLHNKSLARLFSTFGKKEQKHLPKEFYCKDLEYIKGIFDGLIDSDGYISEENRIGLENTSIKIIELFSLCSSVLGKSYSMLKKKRSAGGLKNCNLDNCLPSYQCRLHTSNRFLNDFFYGTLDTAEEIETEQETWDLEVECPSHSFIANGVVVHNSACTTRMKTAVGLGSFTTVLECQEMAKKFKVPFILDGSIRGPRDVCLAIAGGASCVMIGKLFAKTLESAAPKKEIDGKLFAHYRGQASKDYQLDHYKQVKPGTTPEGEDFYTPVSGGVDELLTDLVGGLRSSMSYLGAKTIKEYQAKAEFMETSPAFMAESNIRKD